MTITHRWRKSSYSGGSTQTSCVEVSGDLDSVRDSKNPTGPVLRANFAAFLQAVKAGHLHPVNHLTH